MRIGDLAARVGVSVRALRYYEEQGLLTSTRNGGGQRVYVEADVQRVRFLQSLYSAGLNSRAIGDVTRCVSDPTVEHADQAWARVYEHRDRMDAEIAELSRSRARLDEILSQREEEG